MPGAAALRQRIDRHIANLHSVDRNVSARAEGYLIRYYGARALEPLLEACRHTDPVVRFRAAWTLGHTQDTRAFETLLHLTDDPDARVRYDATIALGILGDARAVEPLIRMLLRNDETRPAADALRRMGLQALPALIEIFPHGNGEIRWTVVQVVGRFAKDSGDRRCIDLLYTCLNDPDPGVQENARFWLTDAQES